MRMRLFVPHPTTTTLAALCFSRSNYVRPFTTSVITSRISRFTMEADTNVPTVSAMSAGGIQRATFSTRLSGAATEEEKNNEKDRPSSDDKNKEKRGKKRINRPGMNSYLKVVLDDDTLGDLHGHAIQLQQLVKETFAQEQETEECNDEDSKKKPKKKLAFRPRSRASLHLTLFFAGEELCELPRDELTEWYSAISTRLGASNFAVQTASSDFVGLINDITDNDKHDFQLKVRGLSLFPPRKNYLVVALLDADEPWQALYNDLRKIALDGNSKLLASLVKRSGTTWIPHITLGNLYGGTKDDVRALADMLETFSASTIASVAKIKMISMGGPIPTQAGTLDWDFHHHACDLYERKAKSVE